MTGPSCERVPDAQYRLGGFLADDIDGVTEQWLLVAPRANPAMLEMFRDRDRPPLRDMVPWAGEFAGKYLTSATQVLRVTGDPRLERWLREFVARLLRFQATDGYLGPWPQECRLANVNSEGKPTWDTWAHYHIMLGLLLWHETTGDEDALAAAVRIADLLCDKYEGDVRLRLVDTLSTEMNLAPVHSLCLLHKKTGGRRYLDMALQIVDEFAAEGEEGPLAGDYLRQALAGKAFFETPKPRWESLHPIMGLAELHRITGEASYRRAFEQLWWSMVRLDRHNTGGFTSGEKATGNPYDLGPIETCCTIAWIALSVEMLKLTVDSVVADEIELSTLNSVVGMHSATGRWATYNTPMNGIRRASAHSIVFQSREGSPELNCCSVNSARGFGMLSDWMLMRDEEGLILNGYGPHVMRCSLDGDLVLTLAQDTTYPRSGEIKLHVHPSQEAAFVLKLRIPSWSAKTVAQINGDAVEGVQAGQYLRIERVWRRGDTIQIDLDMSPRFWVGERECEGLASVYRGPVLLAFDHRYNLHLAGDDKRVRDWDEWQSRRDYGMCVPALDATRLDWHEVEWNDWLPPALLLEVKAVDGQIVRLCDYGSAGEGGTPYVTWLPVRNLRSPAEFSRANPLRTVR